MKNKALAILLSAILVTSAISPSLSASASTVPEAAHAEVTTEASKASIYGDYEYEVLDDGTVSIIKYNGFDDTLEIPRSINGLTVTSIGDDAFSGCSFIKSLYFNSPITSIGNRAFFSCQSLRDLLIPNTVTFLGNEAFAFCSSLGYVNIPDSVTSIGDRCFYYCESLEIVNIPNKITKIGESVFEFCTSIESILIPDSVTSIGDRAFTDCNSLKSINIPPSLESIGESAFLSYSLYNIEISSENQNYIFKDGILYDYRMNNLIFCLPSKKDAIIPDYVTSISNGAFAGGFINSIIIPDSVTSIGDRAFIGCGNLSSIVIPDSVTSIGEDAFKNCTALTIACYSDSYAERYAKDNNIPYELLDSKDTDSDSDKGSDSEIIETDFKYEILDDGSVSFTEYLGEKTKVSIPRTLRGRTVTKISGTPFLYCEYVTEVIIPDTVTTIDDMTFYSCDNITDINIPESVTLIGSQAFSG